KRHQLEVLFHEKPFSEVNGSGKHVNWGIFSGPECLLVLGETEETRRRFYFLVAAVLMGVDNHADVLRASVMTAGNVHRLGGFEAPPAVISVFLGDGLQELIDGLVEGKNEIIRGKMTLDFHLQMLPKITRDQSDRNRTSPFAFIGNRFEFRAVGSEQNAAWPITVLNTAVAEALNAMCDEVDKYMKNGKTETESVELVIKETLQKHQKVVYNEDCYNVKYREHMEKHGIREIKTMDEALNALKKSEEMFSTTNVLSKEEIEARVTILAEAFVSSVLIDVNQMIDMVESEVLPVVLTFVAKETQEAKTLGVTQVSRRVQTMTSWLESLFNTIEELKKEKESVKDSSCLKEAHRALEQMENVREYVDKFECVMPNSIWPYPSYEEIWNAHC
ncbi:glutamine synthetase, putative, partial [Entamoeba invadens IP1]